MILKGWFRRAIQRDGLDAVILKWPDGTPFTFRDLLDGGVSIFGRPGSGKTSAMLYQLVKNIVAHKRTGGLILAASPSDRAFYQRIFALGGRADDLIIFDKATGLKFNPIRYILKRGGDARDVAKYLTSISEVLDNQRAGGGGKGERFFVMNEARFIQDAVGTLIMAGVEVDASNLLRFFNTAATTPDMLTTDAWKKGFHAQCLGAIYAKAEKSEDRGDFHLYWSVWTEEFPQLANDTRSGIMAGIMATIHAMNVGIVRQLLSAETTVTPEVMDEGKFILVDTPISQMGESGAFILGAWKMACAWHTLRRNPDADNCPLVIIGDELHRTVSEFDAMFVAEARKYKGVLIGVSQSRANFYANMPGDSGRAFVDQLLACFGHTIICALSDYETAEYESKRCGMYMETHYSGSAGDDDAWRLIMGQSSFRGSFNQNWQPRVRAQRLMSGMRTGGNHNKHLVDGLVIKSGEPFKSGLPYQFLTWSQK